MFGLTFDPGDFRAKKEARFMYYSIHIVNLQKCLRTLFITIWTNELLNKVGPVNSIVKNARNTLIFLIIIFLLNYRLF